MTYMLPAGGLRDSLWRSVRSTSRYSRWPGWVWNVLLIALLGAAFLLREAGASEILLRTVDNTSSHLLIPWIQLIAAFGIGSIVSAIVGWWSAKAVAISNHRQSWINALRDDIVAYLREIDLLHFRIAKINQGPADVTDLEKLQEARASALLVFRRIRLRLNMEEIPSIRLAEALKELQTIDSNVAPDERVEAVVRTSGAVLKQEWAVTKYGIWTGLMLRFKSKRMVDNGERAMTDVGPESRRQEIFHGYLPLTIGLIALGMALRMDFSHVSCNRISVCHWTMRSGSVITALGIYVAFRAATVMIMVRGGRAHGVNFNLCYGWISAIMLIAGALIWGFADIWF
jgi:hypothetical protein